MPYMNIFGLDIFLSDERYRMIKAEVSKGKSAEWHIGSMIEGNPAVTEKQRLMREWLEAKHSQNAADFRREWYEFRIMGEEASANVWDLLHDWCARTGIGFLADERGEHSQLLAQWSSEAFSYPMGRIFTMNHRIPVPQSWWRQLFRPQFSTVKIFIDVSQITSLVGTLDRFIVTGAGFAMVFSDNVRIVFGSSE